MRNALLFGGIFSILEFQRKSPTSATSNGVTSSIIELADNHQMTPAYLLSGSICRNGNGCGKWERLWERLQKNLYEKRLIIKEFPDNFASLKKQGQRPADVL